MSFKTFKFYNGMKIYKMQIVWKTAFKMHGILTSISLFANKILTKL